MAKRKKKDEEKADTVAPSGYVLPPDDNPDRDLEYHADQLMHHAMKRSRGYKAARKKLISRAKRTARAQNFRPGITRF